MVILKGTDLLKAMDSVCMCVSCLCVSTCISKPVSSQGQNDCKVLQNEDNLQVLFCLVIYRYVGVKA